MRVVLILTILLSLAGTALAGPVEDERDARTAYNRGEYATAMRLFRRAADQGHAEAALNLGYLYYKGLSVPYDYAEAAKWWLRGAELGNHMAQRNIGMALRSGRQGVPEDRVQALMWLSLAAARGNKDAAREREDLAKEMTPAQTAEAQKLTDEWKPKR